MTHIRVKVETKDDIYTIFPVVKQEWPKDTIEIQDMKGGFSCLMMRCSSTQDLSSIVVRVRKLFSNSPFLPEFEIKILKLLSEKSLFPRVYATFENGYCYEYVEGKPLLNFPLRSSIRLKEKMLKEVAKQLADVHKISIEGISCQDYFDKLRDLFKGEFCPVTSALPPKCQLYDEFVELETYVKENTRNSDVVLSHGDLHIFNILRKVDGSLQFLDWELTHINHRAFDIAFFFQVLESIGMANHVDFHLPPNAEIKFLEHYKENLEPICNDIDIQVLYNEVQIYKVVVIMFLMITQSLYPDLANIVSKDPEDYHQKLLSDFQRKKERIIG